MHYSQREEQFRCEQNAPASRTRNPELTIANQRIFLELPRIGRVDGARA
jgi:hypothetical protein